MVEFSIVFWLLLVCLFATIQAAFWAMDSMAAVVATENGVRIAALPLQPCVSSEPSIQPPNCFLGPPSAAWATTPAGQCEASNGLAICTMEQTGVDQSVVSALKAGMVSTPVLNLAQCPTTSASALQAEVLAKEDDGPGVGICSSYWPPGSIQAASLCGDSTTGCVEVEVAGYARLVAPPGIAILGMGQHGFPISDESTIPAEIYTQ
jgi:hypothetical protein